VIKFFFIILIIFLTQCTLSNKISPWKNEKKEIQDIKITEKVLSDDKKIITEFNQDLKLDLSTT
jgi:outer membrane protein assembly factor BamB